MDLPDVRILDAGPRGHCPNCGNHAATQTDDGAQCLLCKKSWTGEEYAAAIRAEAEEAAEARQNYDPTTAQIESLKKFTTWIKSKEGREVVKTLKQAYNEITGEGWKNG